MRAPHPAGYHALPVVLLSLALSGCAVANRKHPVGLTPAGVIPVVPVGSGAPKNARPVTISRPRDIRSDQEVAYDYVPAASPLIPLVIKHSFVIEQDPGVWIGNGLTSGLENAGYHVEHVNDAKDAKTQVVATVDVTGLTSVVIPHFASVGCKAKVAADVKISKAGHTAFDRAYEGEAEEQGKCAHSALLTKAMKKALENLLDKAVPEVATALAPLTKP